MTDTKKTVRSLSKIEGQENHEIDSELFHLSVFHYFFMFSVLFLFHCILYVCSQCYVITALILMCIMYTNALFQNVSKLAT